MVPQLQTEGCFVQLGDADAVPVGGGVLGGDVHRKLGEVEVGADAGGGGDAGGGKNLPDDGPGQVVGGGPVEFEVGRRVDKDLVDGVDHHVLGRDIP